MAETTLLRQSAIVRNASVGTSPPRGPVKTGELPLVQVKMGPGGPQVLTPQQKPVEILPPRDADSAVRTGGLPMVCVKMTSQGPQIDDGQDKPVVILPPRDQRRAVAAGGLPKVQMKMAQAGQQVQNLPHVQSAPPQVQGPPPALSQPRGPRGSASPPSQARVERVAAPKQVPLPPVPEFPADQLMLCRHLVGKYLADLRSIEHPAPRAAEAADSAAVREEGSGSDNGSGIRAEAQGAAESAESADSADSLATRKEWSDDRSDLSILAEATIDTIDQALVAVAVRAEAAAASIAPTPEDQETAAVAVAPVHLTAPAASIIPAAPTASYVAGRVGGRPGGYVGGRVQRFSAMAPRRVQRSGSLPPVIVKMENGRSIVQNQTEVAAARAAVLSQRESAPEVAPAAESTDGSARG